MLSKVHEHIDERIAHLARAREVATVITIAPEVPASSRFAVDGSCDAGGEPLHTSRELTPIARLDDEMNVIALHAEVNDAHAVFGRANETSADGAKNPLVAQVGGAGLCPHRDVHGIRCGVAGPREVCHEPGAVSRGLSSRILTPATPLSKLEVELPRSRKSARHLELA